MRTDVVVQQDVLADLRWDAIGAWMATNHHAESFRSPSR
jgi:hypothetical protein